ncbi:MAG: glycosyl hydrolase family 65 protein [Armatimonadota bacterium]|nr:glycosyl hydrolase family 65 protein [Armatimonadota bacterium]
MATAFGLLLITLGVQSADAAAGIPQDFPRFSVPGFEREMEMLRALYWLHYPGAGPKATMWDAWLPAPSLWPAVDSDGTAESMRRQWSEALSNRFIDAEGYVSVHQHPSIAHPHGWPFPFWNQGKGGMGWHFSFKDTIGPGWRPNELSTTDGWTLRSANSEGVGDYGWNLTLTGTGASAETPAVAIDTFQSPFFQIRWKARDLGSDAQPYLEWVTQTESQFTPDKRMYFDPPQGEELSYSVIPVYKHPKWKGIVTKLRINFGNRRPTGSVVLHSAFTQYDTRHDITGQCFVRGCATYFNWTGDLNFLRKNINRMRLALRYVMTEHQALDRKYVYNTWWGHDGRSGLKRTENGKQILYGHGIGDNYWDLLPFGSQDCYATVLYYDALLQLAAIESAILRHPEWNIPRGTLAFDPDDLVKHAREVKVIGNKLFWNRKTGRFINCIDADGNVHDYGYTFLNFEAIYYDFATPEHAQSIMDWLTGKRVVEGDTSQGDDIYYWRFAPRATTKRNTEYYFWGWSAPEAIPFGDQVQDGGAVLGFSYHDLMARIKVVGADDAWKRLRQIIEWFGEVQKAGGYRKYYDGTRDGKLQGCGTPGGLGLDCEFFESVLVPTVILDGFLGFRAMPDGFAINPRLPSNWSELTVNRIRWHNLTLQVTAKPDEVIVSAEGRSDTPCIVSCFNRSRVVDWSTEKQVTFKK